MSNFKKEALEINKFFNAQINKSEKKETLFKTIKHEIDIINEFHEELKNAVKSVSIEWLDFVEEYNNNPSIDEMFNLKKQLRSDVEYLKDKLENFKILENNFAKLYKKRNSLYK